MHRLVGIWIVITALGGCGETVQVDPRFASPESTLNSLLAAYGVEQMSQDEIQTHMRTQGRFQLRDEQAYRACFDDFNEAASEGLAGFVFGTVAAGKDQLRIHRVGDAVHVFPNPERRDRYVVLLERNGEYKISLKRSVPPDVRQALLGHHERAVERRRRAGAR